MELHVVDMLAAQKGTLPCAEDKRKQARKNYFSIYKVDYFKCRQMLGII